MAETTAKPMKLEADNCVRLTLADGRQVVGRVEYPATIIPDQTWPVLTLRVDHGVMTFGPEPGQAIEPISEELAAELVGCCAGKAQASVDDQDTSTNTDSDADTPDATADDVALPDDDAATGAAEDAGEAE